MYTPRGFGLSEVGDIEIFAHGDELHLFHLTLPNHDVVQHVVSTDGLTWNPLPDALRTSDHGACDDDQIWTMSVSEHDGTFHMLYTALARAEDGWSSEPATPPRTDLITWTKDPTQPGGRGRSPLVRNRSRDHATWCRGATPSQSSSMAPGTPPSMPARIVAR